MPAFCEDGRGLVRSPLYSDDMLAPWNGGNERIITEGAELERESFQVVIRQGLVRKGEDVVFQPSLANLVRETG